ncbi:MAG: hypothetical protein VX368_00895 [Thermoproteota archaeon]
MSAKARRAAKDATIAPKPSSRKDEKLKREQSKVKALNRPELGDKEIDETFGKMKAITTHKTAKQLGVNVSIANSILKELETKGHLIRIGGFADHYIWKYNKK